MSTCAALSRSRRCLEPCYASPHERGSTGAVVGDRMDEDKQMIAAIRAAWERERAFRKLGPPRRQSKVNLPTAITWTFVLVMGLSFWVFVFFAVRSWFR